VSEDRNAKASSHRFEALGVHAFGALARALPERAAERLGRAAGRAALALGLRAEVAAANLARAFPELAQEERDRIRRAAYEQWGAGAVEVLRFARWGTAELDHITRSFGSFEHVAEARAHGKGAVLVTGHFGAFEALGGAIAHAGHPVHFLVRGQTNAAVDDLLQAMRRSLGVGVIHHGGAGVREALRVLRNNECLAIVADQDAGRDGVFVDFFGSPASTPRGPAEFVLRTGAPLVTGVLRRLPDGHYAGESLPPLLPPASGDREADVRAVTEFHARALEGWVRRWPEQWLWTHRRWKTRPAASALAALALVGALSGGGPAVTACAAGTASVPPVRVAAEARDTLRAGDSAFDGAGSSVFPLGPSRVRRVFEGVRVRRLAHGWHVDAEEVFQAGVAAVTAAMGLPDYRASLPGDSASAPPRGTVRNLRVTVDGLPMAVTEAPGWAAPGADLGGLERVYRFDVPFASEEIRTVRLEYEIGESLTDRGEPLLFFYLNPGALWEGEAKVTVSVDLGDVAPEDLIPGWLRPGGYRLYGRQVLWHRRAGDEVADIALAFRPAGDPFAAVSDTVRGPLALSEEAREEWLGRLTTREARFWLAWLERRHKNPAKAPDREQRLAARLRERLSAFERATIAD
jgi:KDO2-lipid IV(A) lauroyltransferase